MKTDNMYPDNTIFIQQNQEGQWLNENCLAASRAFSIMGYDVHSFKQDKLDEIELRLENIYHGGVQTVRKIIDLLGIEQPEIHNPHDHLSQYLQRTMFETTLEEVSKNQINLPFFVKPLVDHKLFTGFVVKNFYMDSIRLKRFPKN